MALAELRAVQGAIPEAKTFLDDVQRYGESLKATPLRERMAALAPCLAKTPQVAHLPAGLTQRELDVLRLLAQRHTDKEIAESLFLGHRTIQTHVTHILNKLGVSNRREAARAAERLGLIE
jgi:DNA-binding NarL/FixJ family response regulator